MFPFHFYCLQQAQAAFDLDSGALEPGINGFILQSNGAVISEELPGELNIESGLQSWKEE